jgi:hypothetical protein
MSKHLLLIIKMLNVRNGNTMCFLARKNHIQYDVASSSDNGIDRYVTIRK